MRSLGFAMAALLFVANGAGAAPLDLKQVPAEARWLVLVDVDGARTADGWRQAHEQFWEQNGAALGPILDIAGLDLKNGWHGLTIYATQVATEKKPADFRGAAIVSLDFDRPKLAEKLKTLAGDKLTAHGPHAIYRCQMSADGENKQTLSIAISSVQGRGRLDFDGRGRAGPGRLGWPIAEHHPDRFVLGDGRARGHAAVGPRLGPGAICAPVRVSAVKAVQIVVVTLGERDGEKIVRRRTGMAEIDRHGGADRSAVQWIPSASAIAGSEPAGGGQMAGPHPMRSQ